MKKLIIAFLIISFLVVTMVFSFGLDSAKCGYCSDQGKECFNNFSCIGDCFCAKNQGAARGICVAIPDGW